MFPLIFIWAVYLNKEQENVLMLSSNQNHTYHFLDVPIEPILKVILRIIMKEFFMNSPNEDGTDHIIVRPWSIYVQQR